MMAPFRFTRGDYFQLPFVVYERAANPGELQEAIPRRDITNDVIRYTAKRHPQQADDGDGVIRKDGEEAGQIVKTDAEAGEGVIVHEKADTSNASVPNDYLYWYTDVEVNTEDGSQPQTVISALLLMVPEITQRTEPL